jgi:hypothetical protein
MDIFKGRESILNTVTRAARSGDRITFHGEDTEKPKTLWAGLGNRSGLHGFASELTEEKWARSGERFAKKVKKLLSGLESGQLCILTYRNITRDRGRWVAVRSWII